MRGSRRALFSDFGGSYFPAKHTPGVEVPSGKPLTCKPGADSYVHVSQAALGDNKTAKGNDRVVLRVKVGSTEVVVGTLSQGKCDQTTLDLIFEKDFILSHNSSGSVYFCGYKTDAVKDDVSGSSDEDELDASEDDFEEDASELLQLAPKENGKLGLKAGKVEAQASKVVAKSLAPKVEVPAVEVKPKAKPGNVAELSKGATEKSDDEDEDEDEDDEDEEDDEDDDILASGSDEEDGESDEGDSDDEDESEEEQPKSAGKKRSLSTVKPGLPGKKSKVASPGKPEPKVPSTPKQQQQSAKKDGPAKKTPGKENAVTPASGKKLGQHFCEPCKKNFNSESALSQHQTAKHK